MRLAGKVGIISGAASGMGAATARMFAREGAKVVIADVLEDEGRQVADAIGASAGLDPSQVAARVLTAIRENQLYVFTHAEMRAEVEKRFAAILAAMDKAAFR